MIPENEKNFEFLSILCWKALREIRKPKFKTADRVRISKYDLPIGKCYDPQFKHEFFVNVAFSSRKPPTYTIKEEQDEVIRVNFYQTVEQSHLRLETFTTELVSNASSQFFPDNTLTSFTNFSPEQLKLEGQWGLHIQKYPTHQCTNVSRMGKVMFFDKKNWKSSEFCYLESGLYPSITDIVEAMNTLIQERHNHSENCITVKMSRRMQKIEIYLANERSGLKIFITDLGHIFGSNVGNEFGVMLRRKGPQEPEFAYEIVRIHSLMIYTNLIEYNIVGDTKAQLLRCFSFLSKF